MNTCVSVEMDVPMEQEFLMYRIFLRKTDFMKCCSNGHLRLSHRMETARRFMTPARSLACSLALGRNPQPEFIETMYRLSYQSNNSIKKIFAFSVHTRYSNKNIPKYVQFTEKIC